MSTSTSAVSFRSYGGNAPENYERYFVPAIGAPLAHDLIDAASLQPGEAVLDVACGTGSSRASRQNASAQPEPSQGST